MSNDHNNVNRIEKCCIEHIAFIMDGNGRWAEGKGMHREQGHRYGAEALKKVIKRCAEYNIKTATFYAFSTENWKRPKTEVDAIMNLLNRYLDELSKDASSDKIRYKFIGDVSVLAESLRKKIEKIENKTCENEYTVNIALNYGARSEIVRACNLLNNGRQNIITESDIESKLYTAGLPELDLLVRTGGEMRLSNFLLWQAAYAELYFTDTLWPDMDSEQVDLAISAFMKRKRRFGGV